MAIDAIPTLIDLFNPTRPTARDQMCAADLWQAADQSWNTLYRMTEEELIPLVGRAHAIRLRTAFAISHAKLAEAVMGEPITSPMDVVALLQAEMSHLPQEELRVISLSTRAHVISMHTVVVGTLNTAHCRIADLFREPLRRNAASIILAHNHPSGMVWASPEDILLTKQVIQAGQLLEIDVLDHLIIGKGSYTSMRERRLAW
ncbi:JAB domain-containing protein [Herpetosiphon geysericola]|uniref:JAB domain-containing protein n=1 Tax=Herpetosiphon geysericola TaxID=70996 RepID=UPI0006C90CC4|nr:JAB domain-containing protein [Herpetosiphon geysericola]